MGLTHPPRQLGGGIRPHAVGPEPVIPTAYRLMRTEVGRERSPGAACMLQVETAVHDLAHIGGESKVAGEQRFDDIPFRVRQVARIASPISLVFLTVLVCPHPNLLLAAFNSRQGELVKQALSGSERHLCGVVFAGAVRRSPSQRRTCLADPAKPSPLISRHSTAASSHP